MQDSDWCIMQTKVAKSKYLSEKKERKETTIPAINMKDHLKPSLC